MEGCNYNGITAKEDKVKVSLVANSDKKVMKKGNRVMVIRLIWCPTFSKKDATWEDLKKLNNQFLDFSLDSLKWKYL